jgi:hypothetical protein
VGVALFDSPPWIPVNRAVHHQPVIAARRAVAFAVSAAAVACLVWSGWKDVPHSWRLMRTQHSIYAPWTRTQRDQAFGAEIPLRMDIIDFWRAWLRPGDRYWIQIPYEAFSPAADKKLIVRSVSHLYLLPAIEAPSLAKANVVLSWDADPGLLHLHYSDQQRAGLQLVFVSRIARGA